METYLHGLLKFTNYSVRLLAYTSVGDGVVSDPAYCSTEQDGKFNFSKCIVRVLLWVMLVSTYFVN